MKLSLTLALSIPLFALIACSGSSNSSNSSEPSSSSNSLTDHLWKKKKYITDDGSESRVHLDKYLKIKKEGTLQHLTPINDKTKTVTQYWEKDGDKLKVYDDKKKKTQPDTWKIKKLDANTFKFHSSTDERTIIYKAADKSLEDITK